MIVADSGGRYPLLELVLYIEALTTLGDFSWAQEYLSLLWYLEVVLSCVVATWIGYTFVGYCRTKSKCGHEAWKLTVMMFSAPICVLVVAKIISAFSLLDRVVCDAFAFGVFAGIIIKLKMKPTGEMNVKLAAIQVNGKRTAVWLGSLDVSTGEARKQIADSLGVHPTRVCIESGKGSFLEDLNRPLFKCLDEACRTTDFFGFAAAYCYIAVKEEEQRVRGVTFSDEALSSEKVSAHHRSPRQQGQSALRALLKGAEARYAEPLSITAKVPHVGSARENAESFSISLVDRFAVASPASLQMPTSVVKLVSWESVADSIGPSRHPAAAEDHSHPPSSTPNNLDMLSDAGDVSVVTATSAGAASSSASYASTSSSSSSSSASWLGSLFSRRKKRTDSLAGKPIRNGDCVVIKCGGKFMSLTRGWWIAWYSALPRRSGAFTIEIIERAPRTQLQPLLGSIKDKIGRRESFSTGSAGAHSLPSTPEHSAPAGAAAAGTGAGGGGDYSAGGLGLGSSSDAAAVAGEHSAASRQFSTRSSIVSLPDAAVGIGSPSGSVSSHTTASGAVAGGTGIGTGAASGSSGMSSGAIAHSDDFLRPGDTFRLRSVKFPDFELGITNSKMRDNYYYLGLRKVDGDGDLVEASSEEKDWCVNVHFIVKAPIFGAELFKI